MPFFIIEKGEPYQKGQFIPLNKKELTVGRISADAEIDIGFGSPYISRLHLSIKHHEKKYCLIDKNSKNGTKINNAPLEKNKYHTLQNGDRITLAGNDAILIYQEDDQEETATAKPSGGAGLVFSDERRELTINGKTVDLTGNLYNLFKLLYENRGQGVNHDEIRKAVWPERALDDGGIPLAADEEITINVMRLRHKLQRYSDAVKTLRGFGYMLDLE